MNMLEYLESSYTKGSRHDRERFIAVMAAFHNPIDKVKTIHVSGTNGKGSTCAMLTSILISAGYTVGTFTSPHLENFTERIKINNKEISEEGLALQVEKIKAETERLYGENASLGFFEILAGAAFNFFYESKVDIAIIETGIGGEKDCTNIIKAPLVSVITSISLDHMEYLGGTVVEIAREKAGIIKKDCALVLYSLLNSDSDLVYNEVHGMFQLKNSKKNSNIFFYIQDFNVTIKRKDLYNTVFSVSCKYFEYEDITLSMLGDYQIYNCCNMLLVISALKAAGFDVPNAAVYDGLLKASWSGRMEVFSRNPFIMLDGAHNEDAILKLCNEVDYYFRHKDIILIIGMLKGKNLSTALNSLINKAKTVIFTQPDDRRAANADLLLKEFSHKENTVVYRSYQDAIHYACSLVGQNHVILIAGSLYLVGNCRKYLRRNHL